MKFEGDERKKHPRKKFGPLKHAIRSWLGISSMDIKLHNTRKTLYDLQRLVEDRDIRSLRSRVRINEIRRRNESN